MKTFSPSSTTISPSLQPLSIDDLINTVGGDSDVLCPEDLLGDNGVVVEDNYEL